MGYFFNTNYVPPFLSVCCPFCDINFYFAIEKYRQTHRYNAHIYMCSNFKTIHDVLWYIYTLLSNCLKKTSCIYEKD